MITGLLRVTGIPGSERLGNGGMKDTGQTSGPRIIKSYRDINEEQGNLIVFTRENGLKAYFPIRFPTT